MSEAMEEIQRLTNEVERLQAVDADREKHFALLKEREVELDRRLDRTTEARDRFRDSLYRLADIVGLTGNRCFSPEAVERQAKFEIATLRERVQDLEGRRFPIQGGPSIPWSMIGPHDQQCRKNHERQSLVDMRRRGGLSPSEALAVLDDESWFKSEWGNFTNDEAKRKAARDELERRRAAFEDEANDLREEIAALKEYRTSVCPEKRGPDDAGFTQEEAHFWKQVAERDGAEVLRLKKAAVDCDFHILKCPVLKGEDIELLDPVDSIIEVAPGTDFGEGVVDEKASVVKMGPDGEVKQIPFPECTKFRVCPDRNCHHYEPEDGSCGRVTLAGEEEEGD